ncbi:hypothetical protein AAFF_G00238360 [Aldrovandia affinis]|uniref:Uncharacterized protein n=1 Tax=Aldrovandia affinis TaxID=143900 RepID=A0AAD7RE45_9TELE|nr:hypothetical protein AAFF_G00238360 [Aldrovandia affinis]
MEEAAQRFKRREEARQHLERDMPSPSNGSVISQKSAHLGSTTEHIAEWPQVNPFGGTPITLHNERDSCPVPASGKTIGTSGVDELVYPQLLPDPGAHDGARASVVSQERMCLVFFPIKIN